MNIYDYPLYEVPECISFVDFLEYISSHFSNHIAFKNYEKEWTYSMLYQDICRLNSYFISGSQQFYYIAIQHPYYFCVSFFSIIISGKTAILESKSDLALETVEIIDEQKIHQIIASSHISNLSHTYNRDACCVIAQSSGTTSIAKSVMLSQRNLLSDMRAGMQCCLFPEKAVYYHVLPYSHLFGIVADLLGPLYSGATITFSDNNLNFFKDMQYFCPTHMNLPPIMISTIEKMIFSSKQGIKNTGGRLKKIISAGAALDEKCRISLEKYGIYVFSAYGLTECSPCISINRDRASKPNSAGQILPCCKVAIINEEIVVHGENVMLGYWNDVNSTNIVMQNGWLHTGDLGYLDEDGFLFLTGRKSNLIVFEDGTKMIPEQIEKDILLIDNIQECLITKVQKNHRTMLKLTIVLVNHLGVEMVSNKIYDYFKIHGLTDKLGEISFSTDKLPRNSLGKIIRKAR